MNHTIPTLLTDFHESSKLPVFIFDKHHKKIKSYKLAVTPNFPESYLHHLENTTQLPDARTFTTSEDECFSVITTSNPDYHFIVIWVNTRTLEQTGYYQDFFPSVGISRLISYTRLLYFALFQNFPALDTPTFVSDSSFISNTKTDLNIHDRQQERIYHNSYFKEQLMLKAVENANLNEFNHRLSTFIQSGTYGQMATSHELRNKKNIALAGATLMTRAAIRGGLNQESAFSLSDKCCQRIESLKNIVSVSNLMQEIGALFIARLRSTESSAGYSIIFQIQDYIYRNQYTSLSLDSLAQQLGYSKNYLCKIFKARTGKTIIQYANGQRIQEAESQLVFTNKSIAMIAEDLGFNDQSYLTKLFIQYKRISPNDFRQKYHL